MTDAQLLNDYISKRDESAFAEIVLRYERLVWSVCRRLLNNQSDREDAFQDAFLILAKSAHRIRKSDSIGNWLYSVTWKTASRIRKRRATISLNDYIECGNEISESGQSQLDRIARVSEFELVNQHLQSMPKKHRTPLILFYYAGLSAKQISDQLNLTVSATEGRLRRAREKLRSSLLNSGTQEGAFRGAMLISLASALEVAPRIELASLTIEKSLAATTSISAGATSMNLTSGAKLMICKCACAAGLASILAIGGFLHSGTPSNVSSEHASQYVLEQTSSDTTGTSVRVANDAENAPACCEECCEDCCGGACQDICESIHNHLDAVHSSLAIHAFKLCDLIGCCDDESND